MTAALNGAGVAFTTIALAGLAFAVAGAISMFFSNYLSRRSQLESLKIDIAREKMEIETEPEEERKEMVDLLKGDGYGEAEVQVIMERLGKDKGLWLREMLRRELKVNVEEEGTDRYSGAVVAGVAFLLLALVVVSPYVIAVQRVDALAASVTFSLVVLFALGSRVFVPRNFRPRAGLESAAIGALAGGALYLVGVLLSNV